MMNAPYPAQPQTVFELDVKEVDTLTKCKAKNSCGMRAAHAQARTGANGAWRNA